MGAAKPATRLSIFVRECVTALSGPGLSKPAQNALPGPLRKIQFLRGRCAAEDRVAVWEAAEPLAEAGKQVLIVSSDPVVTTL